MWTRKILSETLEYPTPKDVVGALLSRMIERGVESSWAHFEVVCERGWFQNLLYAREPWVEVAFVNQQSLQLNLRVPGPKRSLMPGIPAKWHQQGSGLWVVPIDDSERLADWMNECLAVVSENPNYRISGWIDGL